MIQPKIADGTFVIENSSEAVALQGKTMLTREEMAKIIGQVTTNWSPSDAKNIAESNLTAAPTPRRASATSCPRTTRPRAPSVTRSPPTRQ